MTRRLQRRFPSGEVRVETNEPCSDTLFPPEPVKVVYLISDLSIGGAEMALYRLLELTNRRRFDPVVISLMDRGVLRQRIENLGIDVYTAQMKAGRPSPLALWRLIKLVRKINPSLIIGWMHHSCLAAEVVKFVGGYRMPTIWSLHYSITSLSAEKKLTTLVTKCDALLSRMPSKIVFVSHAGQRQHERMGYRAGRHCVIPNGIDVVKFAPSAQARHSVRRDLRLADDTLLIGLIGRYHHMKDHANFLESAALISRTHAEVHFLLVGRGIDRNNHVLCESIQRLGLRDRVHLLGEHEDTSELAAALDILALSSYDESCPNVIGEAMACGVPCVVTNVGDAAAIVGDAGIVVPSRDAAALASGWRQMIELGPEGRKALGMVARARVVKLFPIQMTVNCYENLYETVLAGELAEPSLVVASQSISGLTSSLEKQADPQLG